MLNSKCQQKPIYECKPKKCKQYMEVAWVVSHNFNSLLTRTCSKMLAENIKASPASLYIKKVTLEASFRLAE